MSDARLAAHAVIANFIDDEAARGIELDSIQCEALAALAGGEDVLLCAPTGSGKTMVALGGVELALARNMKCVYTAPIKALSNQKYRELCARYGDEHIGLLTGDETINREAQVLVATTEVLRNMLYAGDGMAADIGYVVLDEVHYLADRVRGPVWEEIIVLLPASARLVSLSATVANAEELGAWLNSVRGSTKVIISNHRPVPLEQFVAYKGTLVPLFEATSEAREARVSGKARALIRAAAAIEDANCADADSYRARRSGTNRSVRFATRAIGPAQRRKAAHLLGQRDMLPAIEFIFSRKGCDKAVADLLDAGAHFTSDTQRQQIKQALERLRSQLSDADARTIKFNFWAKALERGFGAHHAGMFPALKELTEALMAKGLLAIVYATGTLALGIDMPVRTVVLESLRRFDGSDFVDLSATEYTQLIGRGGRRGKDLAGNAVILANPEIAVTQLESVATGRLEPLRSAFYPSYNAVVNLLAQFDYATARAIMSTSFAQFQENRDIVALEARGKRVQRRIVELEKKLAHACDCGDVVEYARLRSQARRASKAERKRAKAAYKREIERSWAQLRSGHLYAFAVAGVLDYGVVLSIHAGRARVVTIEGDLRWLRAGEVTSEMRELGALPFPFGLSFKDVDVRSDFAAQIFSAVAERIDLGADHDLEGSWDRAAPPKDPLLAAHPVNSCPELSAHLRATREIVTLDQELRDIYAKADKASDSVAAEFDATAKVLGQIGFLQYLPSDPRALSSDEPQFGASASISRGDLASQGAADGKNLGSEVKLGGGAALLRGIHNESDLLITMCLNEAAFAQLTPAQFAGICACFLGDRRIGEAKGAVPRELLGAWNSIERNFDFVHNLEFTQGIERTPEPMPGGGSAFWEWASGASLAQILQRYRIEVGDFMAANRRLIDLLRQLATIGIDSWVGERAAQAVALVRRWDWI